MGAIHISCDASCYESAECSGYERSTVQHCRSEAEFFTSVPGAQIEETYSEESVVDAEVHLFTDSQPGKYAASMKPKKNLQARRPPKFWHAAVAPEMTPQIIMHVGR